MSGKKLLFRTHSRLTLQSPLAHAFLSQLYALTCCEPDSENPHQVRSTHETSGISHPQRHARSHPRPCTAPRSSRPAGVPSARTPAQPPRPALEVQVQAHGVHARAEGELSVGRTAELPLGCDVLPEAVRVQRARRSVRSHVWGSRWGVQEEWARRARRPGGVS